MDVYKFGGSSLATAERIRKVFADIKDVKNCVIVLSAVGKVDNNDIKLTDLLIDFCNARRKSAIQATNAIKRIHNKLYNIGKDLDLPDLYFQSLNKFLSDIYRFDDNYIVSRGEYFTCKMFSLFSGIEFINSFDIIKFADDNFSYERTKNEIGKIKKAKFITSGFYGSDAHGKIRLFPRGGGDITGAILANIFKSETYFNCTDVNGIYTIPPDYSPVQNTIEQMNYAQLFYLCNHGNNAFSKDAISFLTGQKINLTIKNSLDFDAPFTTVSDNSPNNDFTTIQIENGLNCFTIIKSENSQLFRILYNILQIIMSDKIAIYDIILAKKQCRIIYKTNKQIHLNLPPSASTYYTIQKLTAIRTTNFSKGKKVISIKYVASSKPIKLKRIITSILK
mgnify:CR=1 FL=1